jgi:hypothetical protein
LDLARQIAGPRGKAQALPRTGLLRPGRAAGAVASLRQAEEIVARIGAAEAIGVAAELNGLGGAQSGRLDSLAKAATTAQSGCRTLTI